MSSNWDTGDETDNQDPLGPPQPKRPVAPEDEPLAPMQAVGTDTSTTGATTSGSAPAPATGGSSAFGASDPAGPSQPQTGQSLTPQTTGQTNYNIDVPQSLQGGAQTPLENVTRGGAGDPLGPPQAHQTYASPATGRAKDNPPQRSDYPMATPPKANILSMLGRNARPGSVLSVAGGLFGNDRDIQQAQMTNATGQQQYQDAFEAWKQQAPSEYGKNYAAAFKSILYTNDGALVPDPTSRSGTNAPDGYRFIAGVQPQGSGKQAHQKSLEDFYTDTIQNPGSYTDLQKQQFQNAWYDSKRAQTPPAPPKDTAGSFQPVNAPDPNDPTKSVPFSFNNRTGTASPISGLGGPVSKPGGGGMSSMTPEQAQVQATAIMNGTLPPPSNIEAARNPALKTSLANQGFDLSRAQLDYHATTRALSAMNSTQQVRLRQGIQFASDSTDKIDKIFDEWSSLAPQSGFRVLNSAALEASKQVPGRMGAVSQALQSQIADLTAELGMVYMGGNSPTEESLKLASKNLSANWNAQQFKEAVGQIRKNLAIRKNSISLSGVAGVSQGSPYPPQGGQQPQGGQAPPPAPGGKPPLASFFQ